MNHEHLIGRTVRDHHNHITQVVSEIDYDIGITLHLEGHPDKKTYCLVNPYVFQRKKGLPDDFGDDNISMYARHFQHAVEGIESGEFDVAWWRKDSALNIDSGFGHARTRDHSAIGAMCAFT